MGENRKTILIVEDDRVAAEYLKEILEDEGYDIIGITPYAEDAITLANKLKPDLIIMDIILNGKLTGCEAAVQIKQNHKQIKIIFLTAYAEKEMIDFATRSQANSYLLKPYRDEEILATVAVVLSKNSPVEIKEIVEVKLEYGYTFNFIKQCLFKDGMQIPLNEQKIKLLELLVKNIDTTVSNEQISHSVWGEYKSDSTIRSLIYRTKEVLGTELIHNSNGIGYVIRSL
jgi:DNA-binding response OmpR family regulator